MEESIQIEELIANETITNETIANETIANETIANETITNETITNETIVDVEEEVFEIIPVKRRKKPSTLNLNIEDFTQSQAHGLFWDNEIREKVFGLPSCINDTKKYDICCEDNKLNPLENVSIKTSSNNNIDCGDILRFFNGDFTKKYTIMLIRYDQIDDTKQIKEIIEIDYTSELRSYLFGSITEDILTNYVNTIKIIPHGPVSNEIKEMYKKTKNQLQKDYNMKINISPKVDSKSQRRVQCSIPKVDELTTQFPHVVISRTKEPIIRGITITKIIKSLARKRK